MSRRRGAARRAARLGRTSPRGARRRARASAALGRLLGRVEARVGRVRRRGAAGGRRHLGEARRRPGDEAVEVLRLVLRLLRRRVHRARRLAVVHEAVLLLRQRERRGADVVLVVDRLRGVEEVLGAPTEGDRVDFFFVSRRGLREKTLVRKDTSTRMTFSSMRLRWRVDRSARAGLSGIQIFNPTSM